MNYNNRLFRLLSIVIIFSTIFYELPSVAVNDQQAAIALSKKVDFFKLMIGHNNVKRDFETYSKKVKEPINAFWYTFFGFPHEVHLRFYGMPIKAYDIAMKMYGYYDHAIDPHTVTKINELPALFTKKDKDILNSLTDKEFEKLKAGVPVEGLPLEDIAKRRVAVFCEDKDINSSCRECQAAQENLKNLKDFFVAMDNLRKEK